jgi:lipoate-protein ligase A
MEIRPYLADDDLLVLSRAENRSFLRISRPPDTTVVIGRGGKPGVELDLAAIETDSIPVYRRRGGGCAVLLDPGNAIVSIVQPTPGVGGITTAFATLSTLLINALAELGVPGVVQSGVSDLSLDGDKIGGSCIYRMRGLLYYTTTLLVSPDLPAVEAYLRHPPREPDYRQGRGHTEFMGEIGSKLATTGIDEFIDNLTCALHGVEGEFLNEGDQQHHRFTGSGLALVQ